MMNEDTMVLYFYRDGLTDDEIRDIGQALEQDAELRARYAELCEQLSALTPTDSIDAPPGSQARWRRALDAQIDDRSGFSVFDWFRGSGLPLVAAAVMVFVIGVFVGGRFTDPSVPMSSGGPIVVDERTLPIESPSTVPPGRSAAVFVRGVATHLEEAQIQLVSMDLGNTQERDELIENIVSQNRFFLKAASDNGADDVARLLRAFEPLLLSLSNEQPDGRTAADIRDQLEFELGVTLTKFNQRASNRTNEF